MGCIQTKLVPANATLQSNCTQSQFAKSKTSKKNIIKTKSDKIKKSKQKQKEKRRRTKSKLQNKEEKETSCPLISKSKQETPDIRKYFIAPESPSRWEPNDHPSGFQTLATIPTLSETNSGQDRINALRWLFKSKLKSQTCFLLVAEFININRQSFESLLSLLRPHGEKFFKTFINNNSQFTGNDWRESTMLTIGSNGIQKPLPKWVPSQQFLLKMSQQNLQEFRISSIKYCNSTGVLDYIQFLFTDGSASPSQYTEKKHLNHLDRKECVLPPSNLGKIQLGIHTHDKDANQFDLVDIYLQDQDKKLIKHIHADKEPQTKRAIELMTNEKIIGVSCHTQGFRMTHIQFLILAPYYTRFDTNPDIVLEPQDSVPTLVPELYGRQSQLCLEQQNTDTLEIENENSALIANVFETEEHDVDLESLDDQPISFIHEIGAQLEESF